MVPYPSFPDPLFLHRMYGNEMCPDSKNQHDVRGPPPVLFHSLQHMAIASALQKITSSTPRIPYHLSGLRHSSNPLNFMFNPSFGSLHSANPAYCKIPMPPLLPGYRSKPFTTSMSPSSYHGRLCSTGALSSPAVSPTLVNAREHLKEKV